MKVLLFREPHEKLNRNGQRALSTVLTSSLPHLHEHPGDIGPLRVLVLVYLLPVVDQMHDNWERELVDLPRQRHFDLAADDAFTSGG